MTSALVSFDQVDKVYRRGAERMNFRAALPGRVGRTMAAQGHWALKGITLEAEPGEILGIIGSNGAGKSTLLKLVARTIAPTRGRVRTRGRVASLIELGVGFHPDLTGADNVRFSAAVLGMSRGAIARRYDEIVAFAGIEPFMGTPVKRYSSGMLARLGFAVAAHLDAEIVLVDEVLSVGDAAFQRKGFEKMKHLQSSGATLLFVTHNMLMVPEICQRAVHIQSGVIADEGPAATIVARYMAGSATFASTGATAPDDAEARILAASLTDPGITVGDPLGFHLEVAVNQGFEQARATVVITTLEGVHAAGMDLPDTSAALSRPGTFVVDGVLDSIRLVPGNYRVFFTLVEEVHGAPLTLHQAATTLAVMEGPKDVRQYGSTFLSGSFQVTFEA